MNDLLAWMSARKSGSAQSFRAEAASLELLHGRSGRSVALYRLAAWNLSKLAHAEFGKSAGGAGWRVAPPVLANKSTAASSCAILCGARSSTLLGTLTRLVENEQFMQSSQGDGPDVIEVHAKSISRLVEYARGANIPIQLNAPLAILAACPTVGGIALEESVVPVSAGWTVSRFSKTGLAWVASTLADARQARAGLFRFKGDYGTNYILKEEGRPLSCEPAIGKFRVLNRRHRPIAYSASVRELHIAAACRPPELVERALVVASGRLPVIRDKTLIYPSIERTVAEATAAILGQRLY